MMVITTVVVTGMAVIVVETQSQLPTALTVVVWILIKMDLYLATLNVHIHYGLETTTVMMAIIIAVVTGIMAIAVETIMCTPSVQIVRARTLTRIASLHKVL